MTCVDLILVLCVNLALVLPAIVWSFNGVEI